MEKLSFLVWINKKSSELDKIKNKMLFLDILIMVQHLEGIAIFVFLTNVIKMLIVILKIMVIIMISNHKIFMNLVVNKNTSK